MIPDQPFHDDPMLPEDTELLPPLPPQPALPMEEQWTLVRYVGDPLGELILIHDGFILGRSPESDLTLLESAVSRKHARLNVVPGETEVALMLTDLGSTNGTFINGHAVPAGGAPIQIQSGDVLRVGGQAFKLKRLDALERQFHENIRAQTTLDVLTKVSNRGTILLFLEKQVHLAKRHERHLGVALVDLDHFKRVNDQHGHAAGDAALEMFGNLLLERLRASDQVGRIGGEEFLIVLPEISGRDLLRVVESIREALASHPVSIPGTSQCFQITASFGAAQLLESDESSGSLLARTDAALYRAKAMGRNRTVYAE